MEICFYLNVGWPIKKALVTEIKNSGAVNGLAAKSNYCFIYSSYNCLREIYNLSLMDIVHYSYTLSFNKLINNQILATMANMRSIKKNEWNTLEIYW